MNRLPAVPEPKDSAESRPMGETSHQSWGRYPKVSHRVVSRVFWRDQLPHLLQQAAPASSLPYGLGRSYGDSCLNDGRDLIDCRRLNRILGFDESTGMLRCESGVSLSDIIDVFLPKGWFLPVTQ